jgi:hypothetical protein
MFSSLVSNTTNYIKLNNATLQGVGHCCYNFDNIANRVNIDGIMLINLNDIISAKWMGLFLKNDKKNNLSPSSPIQSPEWHIISTDEDTNPDFNIESIASKLKEISNRNIELILYLDVSDQINHAYRTKPNDYLFLQLVMNIGHIFAGITYEFNKHLQAKQQHQRLPFSYITCIQKDGFQLRSTGLKPFILSYITSSVNYIGKNFAKNIYLTGLKHQLNCKNMAHHNNSNIIGCLANKYKFISMRHLYVLKTDKLPFNTEFNTYKSEVAGLMKHIQDKKKELITVIKGVKSQAKQMLEQIIDINGTSSNIIIGMNLDMEFDSQIYNGIQYILENLKYNPPAAEKKKPTQPLNPFAPMFSSNSVSASPVKKIEDDDSGVTVEFKLISILDLMSNGADISAPNSMFGSHIMGGAQKKSVCVTYIPVNMYDTKAATLTDMDMDNIVKDIDILDNVISKGVKSKKIFVLTGTNLSFDAFKKIIAHISNKNKPGSNYTPFESKYINYEINPYLRCSMAYYNYMSVANSITLSNTGIAEPFYIRNANYYARFYKYFTRVRSNTGTVGVYDKLAPHRTCAALIEKHKMDSSNCCTCCKCLSRFGTEYHEYKYIPYLDDKIIDVLDSSNDIWIPRI